MPRVLPLLNRRMKLLDYLWEETDIVDSATDTILETLLPGIVATS